MTHKHKVGDELFFVSSSGENQTAKIKSVTNIWVNLETQGKTHRFATDCEKMLVVTKSGHYVGRCYFSEREYLDLRSHAIAVAAVDERRRLLGTYGSAA